MISHLKSIDVDSHSLAGAWKVKPFPLGRRGTVSCHTDHLWGVKTCALSSTKHMLLTKTGEHRLEEQITAKPQSLRTNAPERTSFVQSRAENPSAESGCSAVSHSYQYHDIPEWGLNPACCRLPPGAGSALSIRIPQASECTSCSKTNSGASRSGARRSFGHKQCLEEPSSSSSSARGRMRLMGRARSREKAWAGVGVWSRYWQQHAGSAAKSTLRRKKNIRAVR